jgi:hypothetical protein
MQVGNAASEAGRDIWVPLEAGMLPPPKGSLKRAGRYLLSQSMLASDNKRNPERMQRAWNRSDICLPFVPDTRRTVRNATSRPDVQGLRPRGISTRLAIDIVHYVAFRFA